MQMPPKFKQVYPEHWYDRDHIDEYLKGDIGCTSFQPIDNLREMHSLETFDDDYDQDVVHHITKSDLPHSCILLFLFLMMEIMGESKQFISMFYGGSIATNRRCSNRWQNMPIYRLTNFLSFSELFKNKKK